MGNLFVNLPAPVSNGVGAAQNTSLMGGEKTITVQDPFEGTVTIEVSLDAGVTWGQVASFTTPGKQVLNVAADRMRVRRAGVTVNPGAINVDVAANDNGAVFVALTVPAGNGAGAPTNVAALGSFNTILVNGDFTGAINIQISEDGADWSDCLAFTTPDIESKEFTAQFMRVLRKGVGVVPGLPVVTVGAINDAISAAAAGGGGSSNCLIYQPGSGFSGPVVFETWADLMTRLAALRANANGEGCYVIQFDDSIVTPAVVPAGAYDMTDVTWIGADVPFGASVTIADGVTLSRMMKWGPRLGFVENQSTAPVITDVQGFELVSFTDVYIVSTGGAPLYDLTALSPGDVVIFQCTNGTNLDLDTVNIPTGGFTALNLQLDPTSFVFAEFISGVAGSLFTPFVETTQVLPSQGYPNFLGSVGNTVLTNRATWRANPSGTGVFTTAVSAAFVAAFGDWLKFSTSGGPIAQLLPAIATVVFGEPGVSIIVSEVSGTGGLTVGPTFGDTINGSTSPVPITGNGAIRFISDGVSNWKTVALCGAPIYNVRAVVLGPTGATARIGDLVQVDPTGGAQAVTLPTITVGNKGHVVKVKNKSASANAITITPAGGQTVNGAATFVLAAGRAFAELTSDGGTDWQVTGN